MELRQFRCSRAYPETQQQRLIEIGPQIINGLDADRQANRAGCNSKHRTHLLANDPMGKSGRVLD